MCIRDSLETAAARIEGARYCCLLAAAGPIACGVCLHLKKATRSLTFANHTKQQHRSLIGAVFSKAPSYLEKSHIGQKEPHALGAAAE